MWILPAYSTLGSLSNYSISHCFPHIQSHEVCLSHTLIPSPSSLMTWVSWDDPYSQPPPSPHVLGGQWPTHTLDVWHSLKPGCARLTGGSLELDSIIEGIISLWGHFSIYYSEEILYWSRKEILYALAPRMSERRVSYTAETLEVVEIWFFALDKSNSLSCL